VQGREKLIKNVVVWQRTIFFYSQSHSKYYAAELALIFVFINSKQTISKNFYLMLIHFHFKIGSGINK
jgi:hypothetical protein